MTTPREILNKLVKDGDVDKALVALDAHEKENRQSEQWILSKVEIDKPWVKKLLLKSNLLDGELAERIAEGIKIYSPIKLVGEK